MRTIPGVSVDTKIIQDRLAKCSINDMVTYKELSELIDRNVQSEARGNLMTAMRRLIADGRVFGAVRGVGVKRLNDTEIVGLGPEVLGKIRRASRRTGQKMGAVASFESLTPAEKATHNMSISVLGVLSHMTKTSTIRRLESRIDEAAQVLSLNRTLEAIGKS